MEPSKWNVKVETLALQLKRFATPVGLVLSEVSVDGKDFAYDAENKSISIGEACPFVAIIEEADLEAFVKEQTPAGIEIESITLQPGYVVAQASVNMLIRIAGSAKCVLHIDGGKRINVRAESVDVLGGSMLGTVQKQLDSLNPVLDVSDLPVNVDLSSVKIEIGRIIVSGTLQPM